MLISLNWLKKYVKITVPDDELIRLIGARLVEVEGVIDETHKYDNIYVVRVEKAEKIPETHLTLCQIDNGGDDLIQVVCGAPNVREGMLAAWIAPGAIVRRANLANVRRWLAAMSDGAMPEPEFVEELTSQTHLAERLMCAARTRLMWSPARIAQSLDTPIAPFMPGLAKAVDLGLLRRIGDCYCTTDSGMLLNNRLDSLIFDGVDI